MNIANMHIAVNQGVQKIASHQVDNLLPEEIDFELNKAQDKFIKQRYAQFGNKYGVGFEGSQKRIDDLRTIIAETTVDTTYKGQIAEDIFIDRATLPIAEGYMFLLNHRSLVYHNNCEEMCINVPSDKPTYWIELPLGETIESENLLASSNGIYGTNGIYPYSIKVYLQDPSGNEQHYELLTDSTIASTACANGDASVYFDPSKWNMVTPYATTPFGDLISCPNTNGVPGIALKLPYGWQVGTNPTTGYVIEIEYENCTTGTYNTAWNVNSAVYTMPYKFNKQETARTACDDQEISTTSSINRYSQLDDIYTLLKDPFNKTKHTGPIITISGNAVDVYTDKTFYVPKVKFTYIRTPQQVSLTGFAAPVDCELAIHTHQEIVDMAVASILEGIGDPRYQTFRAEEMRSE